MWKLAKAVNTCKHTAHTLHRQNYLTQRQHKQSELLPPALSTNPLHEVGSSRQYRLLSRSSPTQHRQEVGGFEIEEHLGQVAVKTYYGAMGK